MDMLHVNGLYVTQATVAAGAVAANELSVTLSISVLHVVGNYPALIEKIRDRVKHWPLVSAAPSRRHLLVAARPGRRHRAGRQRVFAGA